MFRVECCKCHGKFKREDIVERSGGYINYYCKQCDEKDKPNPNFIPPPTEGTQKKGGINRYPPVCHRPEPPKGSDPNQEVAVINIFIRR